MAAAYTSTINGYDYDFDYEDQRIDVDASLTTIPVVDVYDAIKEAQANLIGIVYPVIAHAEGLTDLDESIQTYITVILQDNWALNSLKSSGFVIINGGNLVRSDSGLIVRENPLITYFNQTSQAGVVFTIATGSGLSTEEHNQLLSIPTETITESRFVDLTFNKTNTIEGTETSKRITSYKAGTVDGSEIDVNVTYDSEDEYALPESEEVQ